MYKYTFRTFITIGLVINPFLSYTQDSKVSLRSMKLDNDSIRSISNIITAQAKKPIWIEDLVRDNVHDFETGKRVYTGGKSTWPLNHESTNSKQTLKFLKNGNTLSVVALRTNQVISSGVIDGSFHANWEENDEVVAIITDTPELIKCRFCYDSILQKLNNEQLMFIRSCLGSWENKKSVLIRSESAYLIYRSLPPELQHEQLLELTPEMSRRKLWDDLTSPFKALASYISCRRR